MLLQHVRSIEVKWHGRPYKVQNPRSRNPSPNPNPNPNPSPNPNPNPNPDKVYFRMPEVCLQVARKDALMEHVYEVITLTLTLTLTLTPNP